MPRQRGILPIQGMIGEIIFYKRGSEYLIRHKGSLDKKRVSTDPAFERSRQASSAFKHAAQGAGLLRKAMGPKALKLGETRLAGRLSAKMMAILKTDEAHPMGERRIYFGNMDLLRGFLWNKKRLFYTTVTATYRVEMDRDAGMLSISFESFSPKDSVHGPKGATHFELIAGGAALDFDAVEASSHHTQSEMLSVHATETGPLVLHCPVPAGSTLPLVIGLGVLFYQWNNREYIALHEGAAFELVGVDCLNRRLVG